VGPPTYHFGNGANGQFWITFNRNRGSTAMQPLISEGSPNMRSVFLTVVLSVFLGQAAEAQQIPYLFPASEGGGGLCGVSGCISPDKTISVGQITAPVLASAQAWAQEYAALSSAMTIMAPNPGDRFSLTFSGSGTDNYGAAAISGTVRITNQALAFVDMHAATTATWSRAA